MYNGTCPTSSQSPTQPTQSTTLAPGIPVTTTTCPKGYTAQADGTCVNSDASIDGPPSNISTCPSGKPAPESGVCSISADGTTHSCFDGAILQITQPCQSPTSICPTQANSLGGGEIVTNLNKCPAECPNGLIKTTSGCPSSRGSYGSISSSRSSGSSSSQNSRDVEMSILGYLAGCQGTTSIFNITIENNKIFNRGYSSGSDCSDDLMSNVQQILNPTSTAATLVLAKSHHTSSSSSSSVGSQTGVGSVGGSNSNNVIAQTMNITTVFHNSNNETKAIMKSSFENQANAYDKLIDIKKLHSPPTLTASGMINDNPELNTLIYQQGVLRCISYLFDANLPPIPDMKGICDNEITMNISEGQLGANQTIRNLAHEYLQVREIK